jgi:hypothetical protein
MARINEKESRVQVERRNKKKTHFVHFFDELPRSIESIRNTDNIFDEGMFLFRTTFD